MSDCGVLSVVGTDGESKLISVNTGTSSGVVSSKLMSKSVGIGKSSGIMSLISEFVVSGAVVGVAVVPYCAVIRSTLRWARSNVLRISMGILRGCSGAVDLGSGCAGADGCDDGVG